MKFKPGYYFVKQKETGKWLIGNITRSGHLWICGWSRQYRTEDFEIGRMIDPDKEHG